MQGSGTSDGAAENGAKGGGWTASPRRNRSRLTDGRTLLPGIPSQSAYARMLRDLNEAMLEHVGGADHATEPQKFTARRVAILEVEMRYQEVRMASLRVAGKAPDSDLLDLYSRLSNTQRRHLEALGWQRTQRDVTPSIEAYIRAQPAASDRAAYVSANND